MKALLVAFTTIMLLGAGQAFANCDSIHHGDPQVKEAMKLACQQTLVDKTTKASSLMGDLSDPDALSKYGVVAQEWAKALGLAAKELGIAVDEFLDTDAGKLTAAVIIWQVAGEKILDIAIGVPLLAVLIIIGIKIGNKARIKQVHYHESDTTWRGKPKVIGYEYYDLNDVAMPWVAWLVTFIFSWVIVGAVIL